MVRAMRSRTLWVLPSILLPLSLAQAGVVDYVATSLGGNAWRYDYTINNDTPSLGFDELTVFFDATKYDLLNSPVAPAGWDPLVVQTDPGIPADGFYDALNLGGLVPDGVSVSGFSVTFSYLVAGAPGAQPFDLLDSSNFRVVYSGTTTPVPEPASAALMLLGFMAVALAARPPRTPLAS